MTYERHGTPELPTVERHRHRRRAVQLVVALMAALGLLVGSTSAAGAAGDDVAAAAQSRGYVGVDADGRVVQFGNAPSAGDASDIALNQPVVAIEAAPSGNGYWLAASDGGVFTYGDAGFFGSAGAIALNQPIVGMAATPTGAGYWLVAADGGVFTYGDAGFHGSTGALTLNSSIVGMAPTPSGAGYWLVAADGGVFTFGDAGFFGSAGGAAIPAPVVGIAATPSGKGYWLADDAGRVYAYGNAADPNDLVEQGITSETIIAIDSSAGGALLFTDGGASYPLGGALGAASVRAAAAGDPLVSAAVVPDGEFTLVVLHNNDGESAISPDSGVGGMAFFANTVNALRAAVDPTSGEGSILVSSGDNFLASAALSASVEHGVPWFDSTGLNALAYDAYALGNHEFDFGPDALVDFISGFDTDRRFLSANLSFENEAGLKALADAGRIAPSTTVVVNGRRIGIVGATTPELDIISSPRDTTIDDDVADAIQREVDALDRAGVDIIVLISHLQDVNSDRALIGNLSGVDVVVAGGGDELLANAGDELAPGDTADGPYPIIETDADGNTIPVVTTAGDYRYVGHLKVTFDADGEFVRVEDGSGPVLVKEAAGADPFIQANVVDPVQEFEAGLEANVIATSEVELESDRGSEFGVTAGKRVQETNLGNLFADALLWQGQQLATDFGVDSPQIALQNGGGIRSDSYSNGVTTPFDVTQLDTFNLAPFPNFVTVIEDVTGAELETILEHAYRELPGSNGSFAQVGGMIVTVTFDPAMLDPDTGVNPSLDVTDIELSDGTDILVGSVDQGVTVDIATIDFLARGGDGYPIPGAATITPLGVSYQQALENFLSDPIADGALGGTITAADYPEVAIGGGDRILITAVP